MSRTPRHIIIDGKAYVWAEIVELRRTQRQAAALPEQPALFPMHEDHKPQAERAAAGRYLQPSLFDLGT